MAKSLQQEQRTYELMVYGYEHDPIDSDFQLGYALRLVEELEEGGYDTLAGRLQRAMETYRRRRQWLDLDTEDDPND